MDLLLSFLTLRCILYLAKVRSRSFSGAVRIIKNNNVGYSNYLQPQGMLQINNIYYFFWLQAVSLSAQG